MDAVQLLIFNSRLCLYNCTVLGGLMLPDCTTSKNRCCLPDIHNVFAYYTCVEGILMRELCTLLHSFNPYTLNCDREQRQCKKLCNEVKDGRPICGQGDDECCVSHSKNCKYFYTCSDEIRSLSKCPKGSGFHNSQLTCVEDYKCSNNQKEIPKLCNENIDKITCKEDCYGPTITPCSQEYFRCKDGQRFREICPKYTRFNIETINCDHEAYIKGCCYSSNPIICHDLHNFDTPNTIVTTNTIGDSTTEAALVISKNDTILSKEGNKFPALHKKRVKQKHFNMVYGGTTIINRNSTGRSWLSNLFDFFRRPKNNKTLHQDDNVRQGNIEN